MKNITNVLRLGAIVVLLQLAVLTLQAQPLKVGVAGLNHDHVRGLFNQFKEAK